METKKVIYLIINIIMSTFTAFTWLIVVAIWRIAKKRGMKEAMRIRVSKDIDIDIKSHINKDGRVSFL